MADMDEQPKSLTYQPYRPSSRLSIDDEARLECARKQAMDLRDAEADAILEQHRRSRIENLPQLPSYVRDERPEIRLIRPERFRPPCATGYFPVNTLSFDQHVGHRTCDLAEPGDVERFVARSQLSLYLSHDYSHPIASTLDGSLRLMQCKDGFAVEVQLGSSSIEAAVAQLLRTGRLTGLSPGFRPTTAKMFRYKSEFIRVFRLCDMYELSLTSWPVMPSRTWLFDDRFAPRQVDFSLVRKLEVADDSFQYV